MAPLKIRGLSRRSNRRTNVTKIVKDVILSKQELKRFSKTFTHANTTAGVIVDLTQEIILGDTINSRDGNSINPRKLELNMDVQLVAAAAGGAPLSSLFRMIVFQDTQNTGVTPTVAQVLDGSTYVSTYPLFTDQQHRFRILYDKTHPLCHYSSTQSVSLCPRLALKSKIFYNGDTDAAASNGRNSIWLLTIQSSTNAGASSQTITAYSSVLFTDS